MLHQVFKELPFSINSISKELRKEKVKNAQEILDKEEKLNDEDIRKINLR